MNNSEDLRTLFLQSADVETEEIELDNLDQARLVRVNGEIMVENEHGTQFELSELSTDEVNTFIYVITH